MKSSDAIATFILVIAIATLFSFLISWPTYMLWNGCLVGAVAGVNEITWLQAWGLNLLAGLMFRSGTSFKKEN